MARFDHAAHAGGSRPPRRPIGRQTFLRFVATRPAGAARRLCACLLERLYLAIFVHAHLTFFIARVDHNVSHAHCSATDALLEAIPLPAAVEAIRRTARAPMPFIGAIFDAIVMRTPEDVAFEVMDEDDEYYCWRVPIWEVTPHRPLALRFAVLTYHLTGGATYSERASGSLDTTMARVLDMAGFFDRPE